MSALPGETTDGAPVFPERNPALDLIGRAWGRAMVERTGRPLEEVIKRAGELLADATKRKAA